MRHVQVTRRVTCDLPEDGQKLSPKYFGTVINKYKLCNTLVLTLYVYHFSVAICLVNQTWFGKGN